jgi:uncharacterized protein (DUF2336 family)
LKPSRYPFVEQFNNILTSASLGWRSGEGGMMTEDFGRVAGSAEPPAMPDSSARKVTEKLASSGQLRASYLMRVLRQGQMELFDHGFATLLQLDVEPVRKALYRDSPQTLALACRAAGIDRSAFATVFQLCRHRKACTTVLSDSDHDAIQAIFALTPKGAALERLRAEAA